MFGKSATALFLVGVLNIVSALLAPPGFAVENFLGWSRGYAMSLHNGGGRRMQTSVFPSTSRYRRENVTREEHPRPLNIQPRWIDDPASPGG